MNFQSLNSVNLLPMAQAIAIAKELMVDLF